MDTIQSKLPRIPDEIISSEILPRLPVKSLLRFKSVCKLWQSLISHKNFNLSNTRREREHALIFTKRERDGLIFIKRWDKEDGNCFYTINHELFVQQFPHPLDGIEVQVLGSCNGLVLFSRNQSIYIWNPSTRFVKQVHHLDSLGVSLIVAACGFCYDDSSDDYKVVIAGYFFNTYPARRSVLFSSFKSQNWTEIRSYPSIFFGVKYTMATLVNGNLHWVTRARRDYYYYYPDLIVYFDAKNNELKELPTTGPKDTGENCISGLGVVDGCLCMIRHGKGCREVLMMKEYGAKESWTIMLRIPNYELIDGYSSLVPIFFTKNGEVLLVDNYCDVWAFNTTKMSFLHIDGVGKNTQDFSSEFHEVFGFTYVESLAGGW